MNNKEKMLDVAEIVMKQDGLSWNGMNCFEEFRESARYFFEKDGMEFQITLEIGEEEDGEEYVNWSLYQKEEGKEDWDLVACDTEYI